MSYENNKCPCGERKERETMLCADCERDFASTIELAAYRDETGPTGVRRHAAIKLLAMARRRKELMRTWKSC